MLIGVSKYICNVCLLVLFLWIGMSIGVKIQNFMNCFTPTLWISILHPVIKKIAPHWTFRRLPRTFTHSFLSVSFVFFFLFIFFFLNAELLPCGSKEWIRGRWGCLSGHFFLIAKWRTVWFTHLCDVWFFFFFWFSNLVSWATLFLVLSNDETFQDQHRPESNNSVKPRQQNGIFQHHLMMCPTGWSKQGRTHFTVSCFSWWYGQCNRIQWHKIVWP